LGQGARAELSQAAAEELRVPLDRVQMVMADTGLVPDDGITAGSRTTPSTVPVVRRAAAAARELLIQLACQRWGVESEAAVVEAGTIVHPGSKQRLSYADLAKNRDLVKVFAEASPDKVTVTPVESWKVLGTSVPRPNARDLVTGAHRYSSDIERPGMLRGKVLRSPYYDAARPPAFAAKLISVNLAPAQKMEGVVAVRDGDFVGVAAPTTFQAERALEAIAETAKWEPGRHPSSEELYGYLRERARGGVPRNPHADELARANKTLKQTYTVAYVQHAPMETRAAVAEWNDGRLTVWSGTQAPFRYHDELQRAFRLTRDRVRVITPDTGGGFGGKHSGEAAVEAARLAKAAGRPVSLKWNRQEEFTWAYFRPAAVIDVEATLDDRGTLTSWFFVNINSGRNAIDPPYRVGKEKTEYVSSEPPLRHGSYRTLAATANTFARECFLDEMAGAAGTDPLDFRLAHLENERLRAVLTAAAKRFNWRERVRVRNPNMGVGLACGTEKGSYVAACVEVEIVGQRIRVRQVCEVFECGAVLNPANLVAQVEGCILMGMGPALREAMQFRDGQMMNDSFDAYLVPRFTDVPELDIHLLDRKDLPSVGGGETPIIAIAPAIANAVFHATGRRVREMPIRLEGSSEA
jgi:isoquinoline 1-oxidoreductase